MGIVGRNPESGMRLILERVREEGPPWAYAGAAYTPRSTHALRVVVEVDGAVAVEVEGPTSEPPGGPSSGELAPADLVQKTRQMVRAAYKHAHDAKQPPPRQIHRWKGGSGAW
jgi:hypothetical protein